MVRALVLFALLLPRLAAAESLTLTFVPHPAHDTVVAGEMIPVTLRAVYDRKVARESLAIAPSDAFDWVQTGPDHWGEEEIDGRPWIVMERPLAILSDNDLAHATLMMAANWVGVPYVSVSAAYSLISLRLPKACESVPRSTYSSSPPSGRPCASRLGRTLWRRASCAR